VTGLRSLSLAMGLGFLRDRTALFFTVLFPLMFLVLFGALFSDQTAPRAEVLAVGPVPVLDKLPAGARTELDRVLTVRSTDDEDAALEKVRKGEYEAVIRQQGDRVVVRYSAADPVRAATVNGLLSSLVQEANLALSGRPPAYRLEARQVEDESLDTIQYLTPGLIGWAVATGATFGSALTLVTWREKKILRRLRLAPVTVWSVVGARVGVSLVLALAQTATFLAVALLPYFGLRLDRYWWMAVPLVAAGTLAFLSLGMLAGAWARSAEAASAVANIVVLPMAFLSGAFFPLEAAPAWVRGLSVVFPLRHLVDGMQQVMVRGQGPVSVLPELAVLLGFALAVSLVAFRLFRWDDT
jgi:ABC-2 type transport system permease protein